MFMKKILIKNSQIVVHTTSQKTLTDSFKYQYNNLIIVLSYYLIFQEKIINLNHFKMWLQHSRPTKTKSLSYSSILSLHPISDDRAGMHGGDKVERLSISKHVNINNVSTSDLIKTWNLHFFLLQGFWSCSYKMSQSREGASMKASPLTNTFYGWTLTVPT